MNLILKKFLQDPINIGAITPSSINSAKKIAKIINGKETKNIVEIGGGTGVLAQFIENKNITIVERDNDLYNVLKKKYLDSNVIHSCGLEYLKHIKEKYGLLISIPLMKKNVKLNLIQIINEHIIEGKIDWFIILGYRYFDQFNELNFEKRKRHMVINNIPPAFIWHYF